MHQGKIRQLAAFFRCDILLIGKEQFTCQLLFVVVKVKYIELTETGNFCFPLFQIPESVT